MKTALIITIYFLIATTFALNAQSLSGTQTLQGTRGGALCYTVLNWKVNYQFIEKDGAFYLSISNPSVSVANNSLYGSYSKSDLGLSVWPDSDPKPYNFSIEVTITYPGGSETTRAQMDAFTAGTYIGHLYESKFKNLTVSSFKVSSAGNMNYNGGRDGVVDKLIEEKKYASNKTKSSNNNSNNSQSSSNNSSSQSGSTTNSSSTNNTSNNYELKLSDIGIPETNTTKSEYQLNYETGQQIGELANTVVDIFTPSPEKIARDKREIELQNERHTNEKQAPFIKNYLPLLDKAKQGDEQTRMLLYFVSYETWSTGYLYENGVNLRKKWLYEAFTNKNLDAYLEVAQTEFEKNKDWKNWIGYVQDAASLGSVDAMMQLGSWYNRDNYTNNGIVQGGNNLKLALEWFKKAAEKGSPNAMYNLGMIYKYGNLGGKKKGNIYKNKNRYNVEINEKTAFEWFSKSLIPNYEESLFSRYTNNPLSTSFFDPDTYYELSLMYKEGKVVEKDGKKSKQLMNDYKK